VGWFGQYGGELVHPRAGDCSSELVLWATSSGACGGVFLGARGGMVAWARAAGVGETRAKPGAQLRRWCRQPGGAMVMRQGGTGLRSREEGEDDGT
jgi:hypothetical protein